METQGFETWITISLCHVVQKIVCLIYSDTLSKFLQSEMYMPPYAIIGNSIHITEICVALVGTADHDDKKDNWKQQVHHFWLHTYCTHYMLRAPLHLSFILDYGKSHETTLSVGVIMPTLSLIL